MLRFSTIALFFLSIAAPAIAQTVRDSAGIVIVENPAPDPKVIAFRLDPRPVARMSADTTRDTAAVILAGLVPLSGGRFVLAEGRSAELRYYDSTGKLLRVTAGKGSGNGVVRTIQRLYRARADSVVAAQYLSSPFLLFDPEGTYVRNALPAADSLGRTLSGSNQRILAQFHGVFNDGTIVADGLTPSTVRSMTWRPAGEPNDRRPPNFYLRISADGRRVLDTIGFFPGSDPEPLYTFDRRPSPNGQMAMGTSLSIPGLRRSSMRVDGDRMIYAEGTTYEIRAYSMRGQLQRIIRAAVPRRDFTAADIARVKDDAVKGLTGIARESALNALKTVAFPSVYAAFASMTTDDAHRIWVQPTSDQAPPGLWTVYDPEGKLLGSVQLPEGTRIVWIGVDRIALADSRYDPKWGTNVQVYRFGK
jgi:hypothetical protein